MNDVTSSKNCGIIFQTVVKSILLIMNRKEKENEFIEYAFRYIDI